MYSLLVDETWINTIIDQTARPLDTAYCNALRDNPQVPVNTPLIYLGNRPLAKRDYCTTYGPADSFLASERLEAILVQAGVSLRSYPVILQHTKTREVLSTTYRLILLKQVDLQDCIDMQQSQIWTDPVMKKRIVTTLALKTGFQSHAEKAFCIRNRSKFLFHDTVCEKIATHKLKKVGFALLNAFFAPSTGIEEQRALDKLKKDNQQANVWYELALARCHLFRYQEALTAVEQALSLHDAYTEAYRLYGMLLFRLGQPEQALKAYKQEMRTHPQHVGWVSYCEVLCSLGRVDEAITIAQHYLQDPFWQDIRISWYSLGMAYLQTKHYQEALDAIEQAFHRHSHPREDLLYLAKGQALSGLTRFEEALQSFEQGLLWSPASLELWQSKLAVFQKMQRTAEIIMAQKEVSWWEKMRYKGLHEELI